VSSFHPDYFIHGANLLLLAAYSVRDILWLRLLAVASSLCAIPYFLLQPTPLWAPLGWSALFVAINLFQSYRLFMERRPVKLTEEEDAVRRLAFEDLNPRKLLQVLSLGSWITAERGELLIAHGTCPDALSLIVRGKVHVKRDGCVVAELVPGNLVGSALLLAGIPSDVDAVAAEPVRSLRWELGILQPYLTANPETRIIMQRHLAHDLAGKVAGLSNRLVEPPAKSQY
jgi:CRP-like cAMP-binding protein